VGPVAGSGMVGEPDPDRSSRLNRDAQNAEDRPLQGEPEPDRVAGRVGGS